MADKRADPDPSGDDTIGAPGWVKVLGGIAIVAALLFVILHLTGGGLGGHMHVSP